MAGVNFAVLVGNVGRDPEIRHTNSGNPVATFSIATSESWKDRASGERKERTEWHNVVVFSEGLIGVIEKYVRKGSKLYVHGVIRTRSWEDQAGVKRWTTEIHLSGFDAKIILLDRAQGGGRPPAPGDDDRAGPGPEPSGGRGSGLDDLDDEIPF